MNELYLDLGGLFREVHLLIGSFRVVNKRMRVESSSSKQGDFEELCWIQEEDINPSSNRLLEHWQ